MTAFLRRILVPIFLLATVLTAVEGKKDPEALYKQAMELDAKRDFAKAIQLYSEVIALVPTEAGPYIARAWAYHLQGKQIEALADLEMALGLDEGNVAALSRRGYVRKALKEYEEAATDFTKVAKKEPKNARIRYEQAFCLASAKKPAGALTAINEAIALEPQRADHLRLRAQIRDRLGQTEEGLADCDKALALAKDEKLIAAIQQTKDRLQKKGTGVTLLGQPRESNGESLKVTSAELPAPVEQARPAPAPEKSARVTAPAPRSKTPQAKPAAPTRARPAAAALPAGVIPCMDRPELPTPSSGVVPIALPQPMDLTNVTKEQWAGVVAQAKEGMALLQGELRPDQQKAFDLKWAPYFEFPAADVLTYFSKLAPLVAETLSLREAVSQTALACDNAQFEFLSALAAEDEEAVVSLSYQLKQLKGLLRSQSARMTQLAGGVTALGPMPDVKALKEKAKKHHKKMVAELSEPYPFEGEWALIKDNKDTFAGSSRDLKEKMTLEVLSALPSGTIIGLRDGMMAVIEPCAEQEAWTILYLSKSPAKKYDRFFKIRMQGENLFVRLFWGDTESTEVGFFDQAVYKRTSLIKRRSPGRLRPENNEGKRVEVDWEQQAREYSLLNRKGLEIVTKGSLDSRDEDRRRQAKAEARGTKSWATYGDGIDPNDPTEQGSIEQRAMDRTINGEFYWYGAKPPGFDNLGNGQGRRNRIKDLEARNRRASMLIFNFHKDLDRRRRITRESAVRMGNSAEQIAQAMEREEKELQKRIPRFAAGLIKRLDEELPTTAGVAIPDVSHPGGVSSFNLPMWETDWWHLTWAHMNDDTPTVAVKPPPPPPEPPQPDLAAQAEAAAAAAAEQARKEKLAAMNEEIAQLEKSIGYVQKTRDELRSDDKDYARKLNDLERDTLGYQASITAAQDQIRYLETGVYERTRTKSDDLNKQLMLEDSSNMARYWDNVNRKLSRVERLIELAPEDQRTDLRRKWNDDVESAIAAGAKFDRLDAAAREVGEQVMASRQEEGRKADAEAAVADRNLAIAEGVKTVCDYSLTAITVVATAGAQAPVSLLIASSWEGAISSGYSITTGYIEGGPEEAFKQFAGSYSQVAGLFSTAMDSYQQGVLDHLEAYANDPTKVPLNERRAGLSSMAWALGKEAVKTATMDYMVTPAIASLKESLKKPPSLSKKPGGIFGPEEIRFKTAGQMREERLFKDKDIYGKHLMNQYRAAHEEIKAAKAAGRSGAELAPSLAKAEAAYKAANSDFHAKNYMKRMAKMDDDLGRSWCEFDSTNKAKLVDTIQTVLKEKGLSTHEVACFSNSASKGKVGMDTDLGFVEPPRWIQVPDPSNPGSMKTAVNPEYWAWRKSITRVDPATGKPTVIHPSEYAQHAKQAMNEAYERVYGHKPDEAFLEFTFRDHPEAYKDMAWLGSKTKGPKGEKPPPWADFANINPAWVRQAGDVTAFKTNRMEKGATKTVSPDALSPKHGDKQVRQSAVELGHDELASMPVYSRMLEQCRGLLKDFDTKVIGAQADTEAFGNEAGHQIAVNPKSPLGQASPAVQKHFLEIRTVLNDFSNGRIGPTQAERQLQVITGGQGIVEVPEQMRAILAKFQPTK